MDIHAKVELLGAASEFDMCSSQQTGHSDRHRELSQSISHVLMPGGRRTRLLKVLLSNVCENDCAYCAFRSSRDVRRTAFSPDELAGCFDKMQRAGLVDGLFLSSGICHHAVREMDRMITAVEIVRARYQFDGYVHLKLLPGATPDQIARAVQLGDRVSVNLEAPSTERLARLSARKNFGVELMPTLQTASQLIRAADRRTKATSVTTQFVVGAAEESDREILAMSSGLYRSLGLARTYYSAFTPIPDTPLAEHDPTPLLRQHRLYQSDFLLRQYGFEFGDLVFDGGGNLPAEYDPKVAWAMAHPETFPVEVNRADRPTLLRVPGIGPIVADRILRERRRGRFTDISQLRKLGARVGDIAKYILLDGRQPAYQMSMWGTD